MPIQTKVVLKGYFNNGDKPTETEFENLIDSLAHMDDSLGISSPSSDGFEYYLKVVDGVKSWEKIIDANGTPALAKSKLQAGATSDWSNGSYAGVTSGAITGTKGGERFTGQDATNSNYYRYECVTDNNWIRTLLS